MTDAGTIMIGSAAAIFAMAAVTLLWRVLGYWAMGRIPLTPPVERALRALPGCIVVATIVPAALQGGLPAYGAFAAAMAMFFFWRTEFPAVVVGLAAAAAIRAGGLG